MRIFSAAFYNIINNEKLSQWLRRSSDYVVTSEIKFMIQPFKTKIRLGSNMEKFMI